MSGDIRQEKDSVESSRVIMIGVTALAIFALGIVWAIWIQRESTGTIRSYTPEQVPAGKQDEIGMVFQPQFDRLDLAERVANAARERLHSVGWADQANKKVHVPIDRAINDYIADAQKNGGKL